LESKQIEEGLQFAPKFSADGLITAIAQDAETGQVLMVAYMNREALDRTIATGRATYFSGKRAKSPATFRPSARSSSIATRTASS